MHAQGNVGRQCLLQGPLVRSLGMFGLQGLDFFAALERENPNVVAGVGVGRVEPKLVELVGRRALGVEPDVATLGLAKLVPSAFLMSGVVSAKASPPPMRRMSSVPVVMLPHWSLPPICRRIPWCFHRW
jgi:hypothetical protein